MTGSFHLVGIGGAGMSAVARLLLEAGHHVTGSDRADSKTAQILRDAGATVSLGHAPENVPEGATVVVSSAIAHSNPELEVARERGQEIIHRSEALARAAAGRQFIAVAGAHGKTTTSAMIAEMLVELGCDASFAVGSTVTALGGAAHVGTAPFFVAEADESDGSFLNYHPWIALVTNVEPDHLDRYGSAEAFAEVFFQFAERIVPGGTLVACADDPGSAALAERVRQELPSVRVITYGVHGDARLTDVIEGAEFVKGNVTWVDHCGHIHLPVPGKHNLLNAAGAWLVGCLCGFDGPLAAAALGTFTGTSRRFELRGQVGQKRLYDDYAHHPTEVAALLAQARSAANGGRVIALFQPHLYSRTASFANRFAEALRAADQVFLSDIYGAREDPQPGISSRLIADQLPGATYLEGYSVSEAATVAAQHAEEGDLLLLVGAGSITEGAEAVMREWDACEAP